VTLKLGMTHFPTAHLLYKNMKKIDKHLNDALKAGPEYIVNMVTPMK
jgi:hypothetical protein